MGGILATDPNIVSAFAYLYIDAFCSYLGSANPRLHRFWKRRAQAESARHVKLHSPAPKSLRV